MRTYDTMNIGIIECGPVPEVLRGTYVSYPAMFAAQLAPLLPGARFETVSVVDGETLTAPEAQDAWLLTGSRHGVYDDLPWSAPLKDFIRAAAQAKRGLKSDVSGKSVAVRVELGGGRIASKNSREAM